MGGGDPLLSTADYPMSGLNVYPPTDTTPVETLVDRVVAKGVRSVRTLVVDASRFDSLYAEYKKSPKVTRDRIMRAEAEHYPLWAFDSNKGYPCLRHRAALQGYGPSAIHRRSWAFMDNYVIYDGVKRSP